MKTPIQNRNKNEQMNHNNFHSDASYNVTNFLKVIIKKMTDVELHKEIHGLGIKA